MDVLTILTGAILLGVVALLLVTRHYLIRIMKGVQEAREELQSIFPELEDEAFDMDDDVPVDWVSKVLGEVRRSTDADHRD